VIFYRPQKLDEIRRFLPLDAYSLVFVPGAKLVWADYQALVRDFPFLQGSDRRTLDQWILREFSYISETQLELGELRNTKIPVTAQKKIGYRQANFSSEHQEFQGRGDILEVFDLQGNSVGLIDRKGVGISRKKLQENLALVEKYQREGNPQGIETKNLSNGLAYLGEACIEAASMKVTQRVFDWINARKDFDLTFPQVPIFQSAPLQTIEGYFVIQLPFELKAGKNPAQPAAIYARQAHVGRIWTGKIYTQKVNIKQADFFFALCDGGTVRIRIPELQSTVEKIKGGPNLLQYQVGLDLVEKILAGEEDVLANRIQEVLQPLGQIPAVTHNSNATGETIFPQLLDVVESDVVRFHRFVEVIWYVLRNDPSTATKHQAQIGRIAKALLALDRAECDHDGSQRPLRRWGLLLLGALAGEERKSYWRREWKTWFQEPEILAKAAVLLPFAESAECRKYLYRLAGSWIRNEVESLLRHRGGEDERAGDWKQWDAWLKGRGWCPKALPLTRQSQVNSVFWVSFLRSCGFLI
jgi:hypothetical protein